MRSLGKATAAILFATALFCDAASAKTLRVGSKAPESSCCLACMPTHQWRQTFGLRRSHSPANSRHVRSRQRKVPPGRGWASGACRVTWLAATLKKRPGGLRAGQVGAYSTSEGYPLSPAELRVRFSARTVTGMFQAVRRVS